MNKSLTGYKIGFVGLGNMGRANARHLHENGAEVVVWIGVTRPLKQLWHRECGVLPLYQSWLVKSVPASSASISR